MDRGTEINLCIFCVYASDTQKHEASRFFCTNGEKENYSVFDWQKVHRIWQKDNLYTSLEIKTGNLSCSRCLRWDIRTRNKWRNTGISLYLNNVLCHFLSDSSDSWLAYAYFGIVVGSDKRSWLDKIMLLYTSQWIRLPE